MIRLEYRIGRGKRETVVTDRTCLTFGSGPSADIRVASRRLDACHARFSRDAVGISLADLDSSTGTWVNGRRESVATSLDCTDDIVLGDVSLRVSREDVLGSKSVGDVVPNDPEYSSAMVPRLAVRQPDRTIARSGLGVLPDESVFRHDHLEDPRHRTWTSRVHERLLEQIDLRRKDVSRMSDLQLREESRQLVTEIVDDLVGELPADLSVPTLVSSVLDEALGLGPLERFLSDDRVTEIMVNAYDEVFVEIGGRLQLADAQFTSDRSVYAVIERIITPIGRRIDESSPIVDARLKDGSRVNAVIPPLALKGPSLTIRKFPKRRMTVEDLVESRALSAAMMRFLMQAVGLRRNIVVSGGTGAGKTTLLNVLSQAIPTHERIVTIEDAAELRLEQPNLVALESRPPNAEGQGAVAIRELVRNALRMRPDRIVVGECRGGEAIDMLQAMNTGHDGSLTTLHANSPRDAMSRLEVLVLMAGLDLPVHAIREQVAAAVDLVVQQTRFPCGSRRVTKISEVTGVESGTLQLQDLFVFEPTATSIAKGIEGRFRATGVVPGFYEALQAAGHALELECFDAAWTE